jgi:osmoprotectant transport system substrate-binding protein
MPDSFKYAVAVSLALLSALGCSRARPLTVGSKNFTEQIILGEIVAQQLERRLGVKVDRKLDLGGTLLAQQALRNGEIDLYPEYTGTALTAVLKLAPSSDPAAVLERVRTEYRKRWGLEWLDPLGFDNTFAMVVRGPDARAQGIDTLTDAARRKQGWTLGVGYEFLQRPDGLAGLLRKPTTCRSRAPPKAWIWACSTARSNRSRWIWPPPMPPTACYPCWTLRCCATTGTTFRRTRQP